MPSKQINYFFEPDSPARLFFQHHLEVPTTISYQTTRPHSRSEVDETSRAHQTLSVERDGRLSVSLERQKCLWNARGVDNVAPDSTVGGAGSCPAVASGPAAGHFVVCFGEGLALQAPVVYFAKARPDKVVDLKNQIDPYQARV